MATLNAHDYSVGEILTAATMDGVTADLNALNTDVMGSCYVESGSYAGDGSTGLTVNLTDTLMVMKSLWVFPDGADGGSFVMFHTTNLLADDDPQGLVGRHTDNTLQDNMIKSIGTGSFVVSDNGTDANPNKNGETYYYIAIGTH